MAERFAGRGAVGGGHCRAGFAGIVRPPAEADIVAMELQPFGVPLSYGGPYAGVIATRESMSGKCREGWSGRLTTGKASGGMSDPSHSRAAHSPGEGDLQHLHQPGPDRVDRCHLFCASTARRASRN